MSKSFTHQIECIDLSDATDLDVDADRTTLVSAVAELADAVTELAEENQKLHERVDELTEEKDDVEERTEHLLDDVADHEFRIADVESDLESGLSEDNPHISDGQNTHTGPGEQPETALEEVTALPEHVATESLSANQSRARFVASDIREYTQSVPAGRAISADDLSTVLRAGTDCRGHSQTVDRVLRLLDDLGEHGTEVVERRGERRIVFTEECARRLTRLAQSRGGDSTAGVGV
jgi:hypothetical protein